ncbi:ABC transporter ATP-binding protein [Phormidium tenue]|uniref:Macrolide ABC transporter ATP-binding protein n=1 Tax=Phormidium tenue NIES-30 TaxID=549789 RepID=A0A1U7IYU3_9CYAN|nr:ABC transporter ATP-binding protein [Phormidium tenue]MBD2234767.1 ABC transporter ATP-binding protein [Phormidium tenue FACHB-1052]OKH43865.1 macrolide ABC transporter ATP-binding protein [Phormidium tenue NIES-30]
MPPTAHPPAAAVIAIENVSRVFGSGEAAVRACDRINITIAPGEYCAIMGQSGSGKSTLMNIIGCLDRPTRGRYLLDGTDVSTVDKTRLTRIRNRKIGFIFQRYELLPNLTALENVILPMMYAGLGRSVRQRRAAAALTHMGLANRMDKRPSQLSGGQQQRVAIARAIVNQPVLLLADEPTGALDSQSATEVLSIFEALHQRGITIVMVTHSHEVARHSQRIIMMSDGRVTDTHLSPAELGHLAPL